MPKTGAVTVVISGLEGLAAAARGMGDGGWLILEKHLLAAGERVAVSARTRYLEANRAPDVRGSSGVRAEASARGAFVVQTLRKSDFPSLRRPNYGPRMMRKAYLPAAWANRGYTLMQATLAVEEAKALYWHDAPSTTMIL